MLKYNVIFSDNLEDGYAARCYYPLIPMFGTCKIVIRPKYKEDIGLLNHELKHVEQYSKNFFHGLIYRFSKSYRYKCELDAYKEQIKEYRYTMLRQASWIIQALRDKYDLDIDEKKITQDIEAILNAQQTK